MYIMHDMSLHRTIIPYHLFVLCSPQAEEPKEVAKEVLARAAARGILTGVPVDLEGKTRAKASKTKVRSRPKAAEKKRSRPVTQSPRRSQSTATKPGAPAVSTPTTVKSMPRATSSLTNSKLTHDAASLTHANTDTKLPQRPSPLATSSVALTPPPSRLKPVPRTKRPLPMQGPQFPGPAMNASLPEAAVERPHPVSSAAQRIAQSQPTSKYAMNTNPQQNPTKTGEPPHRRGFKHPLPFR